MHLSKTYKDFPFHEDVLISEKKRVTAVLSDGTRKVIYENGEFPG